MAAVFTSFNGLAGASKRVLWSEDQKSVFINSAEKGAKVGVDLERER